MGSKRWKGEFCPMGRRVRRRLPGLLCMLLCCGLAWSEPDFIDLERADDPLLQQAMEYDLELAPDGIGNQDLAEQYYLEFIEKNPDDPLVPYLYDRLANNFAVWFNQERIDAGNSYQPEKGRHYWEMAVNTYPRNEDGDHLLGSLLIRSMVNAAALPDRRGERLEDFADIYRMVRDLTEEDVRERLWLTEREINANQPIAEFPEPIQEFERKHPGVFTEEDKRKFSPPDKFERYFEDCVKAFVRTLDDEMAMLTKQMLTIAEKSREPENMELLQLVADALPDDEPGILAREKLDMLLAQQATAGAPEDSPPPQAEPVPEAPLEAPAPEPAAPPKPNEPVRAASVSPRAPQPATSPPANASAPRAGLIVLGGLVLLMLILIAGRYALANRRS